MTMRRAVFSFLFIMLVSVWSTSAQTTEFTYQGSLKDGSAAANGNYDFLFLLYDTPTPGSGTQKGITISRTLAVADGIFSVTLDFGNQYDGSPRFLEIRVRNSGSPDFITLSPRQPVNSSPHAVKALSASNALQLNGVSATQYVKDDDIRLVNQRQPAPDSDYYIHNNPIGVQSLSKFDVEVGAANTFDAHLQYSIGGKPFFHIGNPAYENLYFGMDSGISENGTERATYFGRETGRFSAFGADNSYFGYKAGRATYDGKFNSFFGSNAGTAVVAGSDNSFFGFKSGSLTTNGAGNTFLGSNAGIANTTGSNNTLIGSGTNVGSANLSFATAIGAGAAVGSNNTIVLGRAADAVNVPGSLTVNGNSVLTGNVNIAGTLTANSFSVPAASITGVLGPANGGTGFSGAGSAGNYLRSNGTIWQPSSILASDLPNLGASYIQNGTSPQTGSFNITGNGTVGGSLTVGGTLSASITASSITSGTLGVGFGGTGISASGPAGNFLRSDGTKWQSASLLAADLPAGSNNYIQNGTGAQTANFNISGSGTIGGNLNVTGILNANVPTSKLSGTVSVANGGTGLGVTGPDGNFLRSSGGVWISQGLAASDIPSLAASYIQNGTGVQTGNFNISGNGRVGGNLTVGGTITGTFQVSASNLTGTVAAANGGTGITSPGSAGNFLRSTGTGWTSVPFTISPAEIPAGSANYIQNGTTQQASTDFNISGTGTVGGAFSAATVNATSQYNLGGSRVLANGNNNLFVGISAGPAVSGASNTLVGSLSGNNTGSGDANVFLGFRAGFINTTGSSNTLLGSSTNLSSAGLNFASAIGANAIATASDTIVIGKTAGMYNGNARPADSVIIPGTLNVSGNAVFSDLATSGTITLGTSSGGGMTQLCINASKQIGACSSSARYKYNVSPFTSGLDLVRRLRPVSFNWKSNGMPDLGLVAEEVGEAEPLLVSRNASGQIEGVKYDRVGVVLLNAVKEQQAEIEALRKEVDDRKASEAGLKERLNKQQSEIDALKKLVCSQNQAAAICQ